MAQQRVALLPEVSVHGLLPDAVWRISSNVGILLGILLWRSKVRATGVLPDRRPAGATDVATVLLVGRLLGSLGHLLCGRAGCLRTLLRLPLRVLDALLLAFRNFPKNPTRIHLIAM